jgi:hypothetical protein
VKVTLVGQSGRSITLTGVELSVPDPLVPLLKCSNLGYQHVAPPLTTGRCVSQS